MTREVGKEIEGNILAKWSIRLGKSLIPLEASIILILSFLDFQCHLNSTLFVGPAWGIARGLVGLHNWNVIVTYRALGIERERYRKRLEWRSTHETVEYRVGSKLLPTSGLVLCLYSLCSLFLTPNVFAATVLSGLAGLFVVEILHT